MRGKYSFDFVLRISLQRRFPPEFTYKNYKSMRNSTFPFYHDLRKSNRVPKLRLIYGLWRSTMISSFSESLPLSDHLSFSLNIISKKSLFITIFASQIVCRSCDQYTDYREVRRFRHFPESSPLPDHFSFSLNIISKRSAFITICASQIVCRSYD